MARPAKRRRRTRQSSLRPDLPPELLADVLGRLQLGDRSQFRGVCKTWCTAEHDNPCRFPMPWLMTPGRCVSLHDAAIYRTPLADKDARGAACRGSFGNWLALVPRSDTDGHCRPFLLHAFTMAKIKLPRWTGEPISKIVLSSSPDSECCTVAAIVAAPHDIAMKLHSLTAVCRCPGQPSSMWSRSNNPEEIKDIAFFNGNLYAVDGKEHIYMYEKDRLKELREKKWKKTPRYRSDASSSFLGRGRPYLVPSHGRLIMVRRSLRRKDARGHSSCPSAVYAFDDGGDSYSWATVSSLEGHAIFVGDACCRAFTVQLSSSGSKIGENQICFVDEELGAVFDDGIIGRTPLRSVQSYDVGSRCLRTYRPTSAAAAGAWRCDAVQCLPLRRHRQYETMPPRTYSQAQLWLWEVLDCLGAGEPYYTTVPQSMGIRVNVIAESRLDVTAHVSVAIPKSGTTCYHQFLFEGRHQSGHQAAAVAAHNAVTFLRSAFREIRWMIARGVPSHITKCMSTTKMQRSKIPRAAVSLVAIITLKIFRALGAPCSV